MNTIPLGLTIEEPEPPDICPDCNRPFNRVTDYFNRVIRPSATLNIYRCKNCKHYIYRYTFPDGNTTEGQPDEPR